MAGLQLSITAKDHRSFDDLLKLAQISRPGVVQKDVKQSGIDPADRDSMFERELSDEFVSKRCNIVFSVPQRRDNKTHHVQAIIKFGLEPPECNQRLECKSTCQDQSRLIAVRQL